MADTSVYVFELLVKQFCGRLYIRTSLSCFPVAPPLTLENVMSVVKGVKRWRTLAKQLVWAYDKDDERVRGVHGAVDLDALQRQHGSDQNCIIAVLERFLEGGAGWYQQPTWRAIIFSLYKANETQLADQFRSYAEPVKGESMYFCIHSSDCML